MLFWSSVECAGGLFKPVRSCRAEHSEGLSGGCRLYDVTIGGRSGYRERSGGYVEESVGRSSRFKMLCMLDEPPKFGKSDA